jgi:hypothetical protein
MEACVDLRGPRANPMAIHRSWFLTAGVVALSCDSCHFVHWLSARACHVFFRSPIRQLTMPAPIHPRTLCPWHLAVTSYDCRGTAKLIDEVMCEAD